MEKIILVDKNDKELGSEEKIAAHQNGGKLHRAFSIFIFNSKGELLLQKRAKEKYHSALLWTNTCCSHPRFGESSIKACHRRLKEEIGFDCDLKEKLSFVYKVDFKDGISENEFDHVFVGKFNGAPAPDKKEVADWKWIDVEELKKDIKENPKKYSYWLKISLLKEHSFFTELSRSGSEGKEENEVFFASTLRCGSGK